MIRFSDVVDRFLSKPIFFVQVGAYDGEYNDPIRKYILKYNWKGIMIEPNLIPFAKLVDLYGDSEDIELMNVAITRKDRGIEQLRYIPGEGHWKHASATLVPKNTRMYEFVNEILLAPVRTRTIESILDERAIKQVDLLQIDAEGMDFEVILSTNLYKVKPHVIHFEERWLKAPEVCYKYLTASGYNVFTEPDKGDTTAWLNLR